MTIGTAASPVNTVFGMVHDTYISDGPSSERLIAYSTIDVSPMIKTPGTAVITIERFGAWVAMRQKCNENALL
jgi:hypothetical protein